MSSAHDPGNLLESGIIKNGILMYPQKFEIAELESQFGTSILTKIGSGCTLNVLRFLQLITNEQFIILLQNQENTERLGNFRGTEMSQFINQLNLQFGRETGTFYSESEASYKDNEGNYLGDKLERSLLHLYNNMVHQYFVIARLNAFNIPVFGNDGPSGHTVILYKFNNQLVYIDPWAKDKVYYREILTINQDNTITYNISRVIKNFTSISIVKCEFFDSNLMNKYAVESNESLKKIESIDTHILEPYNRVILKSFLQNIKKFADLLYFVNNSNDENLTDTVTILKNKIIKEEFIFIIQYIYENFYDALQIKTNYSRPLDYGFNQKQTNYIERLKIVLQVIIKHHDEIIKMPIEDSIQEFITDFNKEEYLFDNKGFCGLLVEYSFDLIGKNMIQYNNDLEISTISNKRIYGIFGIKETHNDDCLFISLMFLGYFGKKTYQYHYFTPKELLLETFRNGYRFYKIYVELNHEFFVNSRNTAVVDMTPIIIKPGKYYYNLNHTIGLNSSFEMFYGIHENLDIIQEKHIYLASLTITGIASIGHYFNISKIDGTLCIFDAQIGCYFIGQDNIDTYFTFILENKIKQLIEYKRSRGEINFDINTNALVTLYHSKKELEPGFIALTYDNTIHDVRNVRKGGKNNKRNKHKKTKKKNKRIKQKKTKKN
jgi:hypothetical protein